MGRSELIRLCCFSSRGTGLGGLLIEEQESPTESICSNCQLLSKTKQPKSTLL